MTFRVPGLLPLKRALPVVTFSLVEMALGSRDVTRTSTVRRGEGVGRKITRNLYDVTR